MMRSGFPSLLTSATLTELPVESFAFAPSKRTPSLPVSMVSGEERVLTPFLHPGFKKIELIPIFPPARFPYGDRFSD
jgi:hypothetical protein